jgi:ATP-dependent DNA helicase DinG
MQPMGHFAGLLGPDGPLARVIDGFESRREQQVMADWVGETLDARGMLAVEAGTGTGKTFGYLVPVLLSGRQAIISTGTRTLQDQLFHRDLPTVAAFTFQRRGIQRRVHSKCDGAGPQRC